MVWGAIIGAVASVAGGVMGNRASAGQASQNRDFQLEMSSTAYQRAMVDMRRAGLNPMLAYSQGPASSPSGSTAQQGDLGGASAASAISQAQIRKSGAAQADSQTNLNRASAKNVDQDTKLKSQQQRESVAREAETKQKTSTDFIRGQTLGAQAGVSEQNIRRLRLEIDKFTKSGSGPWANLTDTAIRTLDRILKATEPASSGRSVDKKYKSFPPGMKWMGKGFYRR